MSVSVYYSVEMECYVATLRDVAGVEVETVNFEWNYELVDYILYKTATVPQ